MGSLPVPDVGVDLTKVFNPDLQAKHVEDIFQNWNAGEVKYTPNTGAGERIEARYGNNGYGHGVYIQGEQDNNGIHGKAGLEMRGLGLTHNIEGGFQADTDIGKGHIESSYGVGASSSIEIIPGIDC